MVSLSKEKIQLTLKNTPIFTIIKPVFLPNKKNEPIFNNIFYSLFELFYPHFGL